MNYQLIKSKHLVFTYAKKPETKASYLLAVGANNIFPTYITLSSWELAPIANQGRARIEKKVADLKTTFRKNESSPYKICKPFAFSSSIWENPDYPVFLGYGDVGRTGFTTKTEATKDLIIVYVPINEERIEIHLFSGLVEFKNEAFDYLANYIKQQKP